MLIDKRSERIAKESNIEEKSIPYFVNPETCVTGMVCAVRECTHVETRGDTLCPPQLLSPTPLFFKTEFFTELVNLARSASKISGALVPWPAFYLSAGTQNSDVHACRPEPY